MSRAATKTNNILASLTLLALATPACHGPSMLYDQSAPASFETCPNAASAQDAPMRSYAALMKSLAEHGWKFDVIAPQAGTLVATACVAGGADCVAMVFSVDSMGNLTAYRDPSREVSDEMDGAMLRWMRFVDQRFALYRCMSPDLALEELKRYGAIQEAAAPAPLPTTAPQQPPPAAQPPVAAQAPVPASDSQPSAQ